MADSSIEVEGYRIKAVDSGNGVYKLSTSSTKTDSDVTVECAELFGPFRGEGTSPGIKMRLTPAGGNDPVTGQPLYSVVTT